MKFKPIINKTYSIVIENKKENTSIRLRTNYIDINDAILFLSKTIKNNKNCDLIFYIQEVKEDSLIEPLIIKDSLEKIIKKLIEQHLVNKNILTVEEDWNQLEVVKQTLLSINQHIIEINLILEILERYKKVEIIYD